MAKKKLVIIDGKSVFYRGYYAMPNLVASDGTPTSGVYGFTMMALRVLKELNPNYVIVAWDKSKTNIRARRKLYKEYKANRKPMPDDLRAQIPLVRELLEGFSWPLLEIDDFEADDIMAALSKQARQKKLKTILVTSDLDILQAVNGDTEVLALKRGLTQTVRYTKEKFTEEYGMTPDQFIDYKALKGDSSDNVPGVAGVGDKTAKQLIEEFGTLGGIYDNLDKIKEPVRKKLEADKDMAFLSHKLLEIRFDAPVKLDLKAADVKDANPERIAELFRRLNFFRHVTKELPEQMRVSNTQKAKSNKQLPDVKVQTLNTKVELAKLKLGQEAAVYATSEINPSTQLPEINQLLLSPGPNQAFVVSDAQLQSELFKRIKTVKLIGFDLKNVFKAAAKLESTGLFDLLIAAFILNPLGRYRDIQELAEVELNITLFDMHKQAQITEEAAKLITQGLWGLYGKLSSKLDKAKMLKKVAQDLDFPMVPVLAKVERVGVKINTEYFEKMAKNIERRIEDAKELIYKEAKTEFNIGSPGQLAEVLFEKLRLPTEGIKRGKTGYSTAASELEKLRGLHPIIDLISQYRELTKLKNTYIDVLPKLVDKNSRLHTTFSQTTAQTGRLSSENPNLQNIPIRSEVGKEIRQAFVAEAGNSLISADYSQFELRLAAVLAGDKNMIHAFNRGIDIHAMTAAEIYDLEDVEMVTADQRRAAKVVNFGVLYGMSPHGLSMATGMSREQAKEFIDKYFSLRQSLLNYLEGLKKKAKKDGYVETLFGRRRPMPDITSSNWAVRAAAERAAINMPIQGTAADIMKLAMIEINKNLSKDCQMILQIHDSILVEAPKSKADDTADTLKKVMENVNNLPVDLDVDVKIGNTWGELL